jgi:ketosteroid isomerase-like protein
VDLEARLERLEARQALRELAGAYCAAVDGKDAERLAALFTVDGTLSGMRGPAVIVASMRRWMAAHRETFHSVHDQQVEFTSPDTATGSVTGHAEQRRGDEVWVMAIRYTDAYRREASGWRFASRSLHYVYRLRAQDYPAHFGEVVRDGIAGSG